MKKIWLLIILFLVGCGPNETEVDISKTDEPSKEVEDKNVEDNNDVAEVDVTDETVETEDPVEPTEPTDPEEEPDEIIYDTFLAELLGINIYESQVDEMGMNYDNSASWVVPFTEDQMIELGMDGFTGTDKEIADAILNWQVENMHYASMESGFNDVSYGMRWNGAFPTIYDTEDIITRQIADDGKIYGVCHHYANIFAAAADYYGLTVRIGISNEDASDMVDNPYGTLSATGMSGEEYNAFVAYLEEEGYDVDAFPYEVVRLLMGGGAGGALHGRAEVYLDGEWIPYDKYIDGTTEEGSTLTYSYDTWLSGFQPEKYDEFMVRYKNGESLLNEGYGSAYEQFLEARIIATSELGLPGYGGAFDYIGVIDDLGQNRAANVNDIMNGLALAPYFDNAIDILEFFGSPNWLQYEIDDVMEVQAEIEELTGKPYYSVAEIMTWGEEDITDPEIFVEMYEGFSGVPFNINLWDEYIK